MREKILTFIENNSRIELKDLAVMLGSSETEVANEIADMEKEGIICLPFDLCLTYTIPMVG